MNKIIEKNGATEILEIIMLFTMITFIVLFPLASFSITQKQNFLEDTKTLALQYASREGGVDTAVQSYIMQDLKAKGFNTTNAIIETNADGTATKPLISRSSNTEIVLQIYVPATSDVIFIKTLWGLVGLKPGASGYFFGGASTKYWYYTKGYVLSEKL